MPDQANTSETTVYEDVEREFKVIRGQDYLQATWQGLLILTVQLEDGKPMVYDRCKLVLDYEMAINIMDLKRRTLTLALMLNPLVHDRTKSLSF